MKKKSEQSQPLIGAHQSIAGGIHTAFERGERSGCATLQVFVKNNNQWKGKPLTDEDIANYKTTASKSTITPVVAHSCYLINLCSTNTGVLEKSREAYLDELKRCEALGIPYFNFHPGAHLGAGEEEGMKKIIESLDVIHDQTKGYKTLSVLETTAGQGSALGYKFEQLRTMIEGVQHPERMGVCIDTCHVFAAGYDLRTEKEYEKTMREFDEIVGLDRLFAIHVNDSKRELGSRVDRHEHIGKGAMGESSFRLLMRDERLQNIPKILETPKEEDLEEDRVNLATLRRLAKLD
ncbi:MAG TPA: deoxyribonuclease IV [Bacteroidota bacterium]|nr:deoxyribonuclease IV [Bacteroidota bacterium]